MSPCSWSQPPVVAVMVGPHKNFVLHFSDRSSGCKFLVSLIPAGSQDRHVASACPALQAANRSSIHTFGTCIVPITIGGSFICGILWLPMLDNHH